MRKNKKVALFGSLTTMTVSAMMIALSAVIGYICKTIPALNLGTGLRITFENLPIIVAGIMFGPVVGGVVGAATDIISYFLSGQAYPINILVTLGATLIGVISGFLSRYAFKNKGYARIIIPSALAHVIGSMIIKPIGLFAFYGWAVLWRVPMYFVIAPMEIVIICLMYRNSTVRKLIDGGF